MRHGEFKVGIEFRCAGRLWRCTDVGTRVIVAISLEPHEVTSLVAGQEQRHTTNDPSWLSGPPYAVVEQVFDETDIPACTLDKAARGL